MSNKVNVSQVPDFFNGKCNTWGSAAIDQKDHSGQFNQQKAKVGSGMPRASVQILNHHDEFEKQQKPIAARSISNTDGLSPVVQKIRKYLTAIQIDIKGTEKDSSGFPEIANIIIKLGKYIRKNDVSGIDRETKEVMNQLVVRLLKDSHFEAGGRASKLWAVHVDIVWLAHEMQKKNLRDFQLLEVSRQKAILQIGKERINAAMHPLLLNNFTAIKELWKPNLSYDAAKEWENNFGYGLDTYNQDWNRVQKKSNGRFEPFSKVHENQDTAEIRRKNLNAAIEKGFEVVEQLRKESGELEAYNQMLNRKSEELREKYKQDAEKFAQEIGNLSSQLNGLQKKYKEGTLGLENLEKKSRNLKEKIEKLEESKNKSKEEFENVENEKAASTRELEELKKKSIELGEKYIQEAEKFAQEIESLTGQLSGLQLEHKQGLLSLEELEKKSQNLESKIEKLQESKNKTKEEFETIENQKAFASKELEELKKAL